MDNRIVLIYCIILWILSIGLGLLASSVTNSFIIGIIVMVAIQFYGILYTAIEHLRRNNNGN